MKRGVFHNLVIGVNMLAVVFLSAYALISLYSSDDISQGRVLAARQLPAPEPFSYDSVLLSDTAEQIQAKRTVAGLSGLQQSERLDLIAAERAASMQAERYYAHREPDGSDFSDQLKGQGNNYSFACENLNILEKPNPAGFIASWEASPAHRECLYRNGHTHAGYAATTVSFDGGASTYTIIVAIYADLRN